MARRKAIQRATIGRGARNGVNSASSSWSKEEQTSPEPEPGREGCPTGALGDDLRRGEVRSSEVDGRQVMRVLAGKRVGRQSVTSVPARSTR